MSPAMYPLTDQKTIKRIRDMLKRGEGIDAPILNYREFELRHDGAPRGIVVLGL